MKFKDCKIGVPINGLEEIPGVPTLISGFITSKPFLVKIYYNYYDGSVRTIIKTTFYIAVWVSLTNGSSKYFDIRKLQKL